MSLNIKITISDTLDYKEIAKRAFPDSYKQLKVSKLVHKQPGRKTTEKLEGKFYNTLGFWVSIYGETQSLDVLDIPYPFVELESYNGNYTKDILNLSENGKVLKYWIPKKSVNLYFGLDKTQIALANYSAIQVLSRLLVTGKENMVFETDDWVRLTRFDYVVSKQHYSNWWKIYNNFNDLIPD